MRGQTPSQTVGPFFHYGLIMGGENVMVTDDTHGERIRVEGIVHDGEGAVLPDAMIEVWQANSHGRYAHPDDTQDKPLDPGFKGYGRVPTDADGRFWFDTIKPGAVPGPGNTLQAPHVNLTIFGRGMLIHQVTRFYFEDEATNATDPVLTAIEDPARRAGLVARKAQKAGRTVYHLDIYLQGEKETVFFQV